MKKYWWGSVTIKDGVLYRGATSIAVNDIIMHSRAGLQYPRPHIIMTAVVVYVICLFLEYTFNSALLPSLVIIGAACWFIDWVRRVICIRKSYNLKLSTRGGQNLFIIFPNLETISAVENTIDAIMRNPGANYCLHVNIETGEITN